MKRDRGASSFGTLLFLALIVGGIYYMRSHPDTYSDLRIKMDSFLNSGTATIQKELSGLVSGDIPFSIPGFGDSLSGEQPAGSVSGQSVQPISQATTPAPLVKIDTPKKSSSGKNGQLTVGGIISQTNTQRQKNGQAVLSESTKLNASAQVKAQDILARQYFEHTAPDGITASDLITAQGYSYLRVGENLALGNFKDDADVVGAWMNSPGHRANILDAHFTEIGIGVATGTYEGRTVLVAVQHFGTPRGTCPSINDSLRISVENGQAELIALAKTLDMLKNEIEKGRAEGKDMNIEVGTYNAGIDRYQKLFAENNSQRIAYNAQVAAFNSCLKNSQ